MVKIQPTEWSRNKEVTHAVFRFWRYRLCEKMTKILEPIGLCNRCFYNSLGQHICVCIPNNLNNTKNTATHDEVRLSVNSYSPTLASQTLVHQSSKVLVHNRLFKEPASQLQKQTCFIQI